MACEKEDIKSPEFQTKISELAEELSAVSSDLRILREAEEFHKQVSCLSIEDLLRPFTI